jgi:hypothetical protein
MDKRIGVINVMAFFVLRRRRPRFGPAHGLLTALFRLERTLEAGSSRIGI